MNKEILSTLTKEQLTTLTARLDITKSSFSKKPTKAEILDEICITINGMEVIDNVTFTDSKVIAIANGMTIDEALSINKLEATSKYAQGESTVNVIESADFNTQKVETVVEKSDLNLENMSAMLGRIYAKLSAENQKDCYDFNTLPRVILKNTLKALRIEDRLYDVAFVMTFGMPQGIDMRRYECNFSNEHILSKYDKEQIARREIAINNSMMKKKPSEKQMETLARVISNVEQAFKDTKLDYLNVTLGKLSEVECDFNANALQFKLAINDGYEALSKLPISVKQKQLTDKMIKVGIKPQGKLETSGEASKFIKANISEYYRRAMSRNLDVIGVFNQEEIIRKMSDEELKENFYTLNKVYNMLGLVTPNVDMNIWELINILKSKSEEDLHILQVACVTKNNDLVMNTLNKKDLEV